MAESKFVKFLGFMWHHPLSWVVIDAAGIMALVPLNIGRLDWQDFVGIISLLVMITTVNLINMGEKREAVGLENIPVEFQNLRCSKQVLSDATRRLKTFCYNKLEEKLDIKCLKFLGFMWKLLSSWIMPTAAIMAIALANGGGKPPDWQDIVGIIALLIINSTINFVHDMEEKRKTMEESSLELQKAYKNAYMTDMSVMNIEDVKTLDEIPINKEPYKNREKKEKEEGELKIQFGTQLTPVRISASAQRKIKEDEGIEIRFGSFPPVQVRLKLERQSANYLNRL